MGIEHCKVAPAGKGKTSAVVGNPEGTVGVGDGCIEGDAITDELDCRRGEEGELVSGAYRGVEIEPRRVASRVGSPQATEVERGKAVHALRSVSSLVENVVTEVHANERTVSKTNNA